jgi:hydrogenase/urease accessory protein HupE
MRILLAAVLVLLGCPAIHAHEIGTTRVSVVLHEDRRYDVEIVTDAAALAEKLAAVTGRTARVDSDPSALQSTLTEFDEPFQQRVKIRFDTSADRPAIAYAVAPAADASSAAIATIRLTGTVPANARDFTWSFGWTFASYAMTVRHASSASQATEWLDGGQMSTPFALQSAAPASSRLRVAWRYLTLGFTHIVPGGLDHVLFVLGIYLLSGRPRAVLSQVTAFTVAHSLTLALSIYGVVTVSPRFVEPLIALSIAYVAVENIFLSELRSRRVALVFAFGLLHGLGFAGALTELGLPRAEFATALVTFNAGVEAGQLAVIGTAFLLVGWHCANRAWYRSRIVVPASALIACVSVYWTIARVWP